MARFTDLTSEEASDLILSAQTVGRIVEKQYGGEALTLSIQDGKAAGQTVAHVHVHLIPRRKGDWANNDDIYPELDAKEKEMAKQLEETKKKGVDNDDRKPRTEQEMGEEAAALRPLFDQFENIW